MRQIPMRIDRNQQIFRIFLQKNRDTEEFDLQLRESTNGAKTRSKTIILRSTRYYNNHRLLLHEIERERKKLI